MDPFIKDLFQIIAWSVLSIGGIIAAFRAIIEMQRNRAQRAKDLRWRQAQQAKLILDEITVDDYSSNAMQMLDWSGREYEIKEGKIETIEEKEVWKALRATMGPFNEKEAYIRDCFDHFFDFLERTEHFMRIELIGFEDIRYPLEYYVNKLSGKHQVVEEFLRLFDYQFALEFLRRFPVWVES